MNRPWTIPCVCRAAVWLLGLGSVLAEIPATNNATSTTHSNSVRAAEHWAFRPPLPAPLPAVKARSWVRTPVDQFILARLEKEKLTPSPEADRPTLIRRLSFDLLGLPPTPAQVEEFLSDTQTNAYERLVERLLASPHYGERWGRHWLDVAGYADSNGYFDADSDRPLAWKYRDYVIRSFNDDKPFAQFIREQIAGDELAGYHPDADVTPAMVELLTATHFLRNGPDGTGESDGNPLELKVDRYAVLEWNVQIIGSSLLGLTVQCARCHDHKFEPFTQEEYYQLQAILRTAYDPDKWRKPNERVVTIGSKAERDQSKRDLEQFEREVKALKESLDGLLKPFRDLVLDENLAKFSEVARIEIKQALDTKEKKRTNKMKELLKANEALVQLKDEDLLKRFPTIAPSYNTLKESIKKREGQRPPGLPQLAALTEMSDKPPEHFILVRGNYAKPGRAVQPGVPAVLSLSNRFELPATLSAKNSGRRTALANWLTSPEQPTVARLMVNRVWQRHFGAGLVATPENLGVTGAPPSNAALLDWLAVEFVRAGWSVKALHRWVVLSATYRQAAGSREAQARIDPDNRWLWHFPMQRLDAEAVRDAMLSVSGEIDLHVGGPYVATDKTEEGQYVVNEKNVGYKRRSLYLQQKRSKPLSLLDVFDGAQMNPNCTRRNTSTISLQSLTLLNSEFVRNRSRALAARLEKESSADASQRLGLAFQLAYGRKPKPPELAAAEKFLADQRASYSSEATADARAWTDLCQMLLASNAFLYIE